MTALSTNTSNALTTNTNNFNPCHTYLLHKGLPNCQIYVHPECTPYNIHLTAALKKHQIERHLHFHECADKVLEWKWIEQKMGVQHIARRQLRTSMRFRDKNLCKVFFIEPNVQQLKLLPQHLLSPREVAFFWKITEILDKDLIVCPQYIKSFQGERDDMNQTAIVFIEYE